MKFIATTSDKVSNIEVKLGQLIFSRDDRVIYLDSDVRTSFQQIITILDEETRQKLPFPVEGFYFVESSSILWYYKNSIWTQITQTPTEQIVFLNRSDFPTIGKEKILYVDESNIYQWNKSLNDYVKMSGGSGGDLEWGPIA